MTTTVAPSFTNTKVPVLATEPPYEQDFKVNQTINNLLTGRSNGVGTFTLAANDTATTVQDPSFQSQMAVFLIPTTANAAAEVAAGGLYLSNRLPGSFTFTHANNALTDRTFLYVRLG